MTVEDKESPLSRWSRRKLEAREVVEAEALEPTDAVAKTAEEIEEKPVLTDADMPDIETLSEDSDYSGFMSAGVSDELRNLALRKLFRSSVFNIRDGLDEYDDDFTQFEKLGDIVTSDMKHQMEIQAQKLREKLAAEAEMEPLDEDGAETEEFDDEEMAAETDVDESEIETELNETEKHERS